MKAEREGEEPLVVWGSQRPINDLPFLGMWLPAGWRRWRLTESFEPNRRGISERVNEGYGAYLADATGRGRRGGPALTMDEMVERIQPGYGYAIIIAGIYRLLIGVYKSAAIAKSGAAGLNAGISSTAEGW